MKAKILLTALLAAAIMPRLHAQTTMARGADVSWCTEMEASGKRFYDSEGRETELMQLLRSIGMTAVRLRVWVNPETTYGAWCDQADVVAKAVRAKAAGLDVMIDFHYSDFFADPGRQTVPSAWSAYTLDQLKTAVGDHTRAVLQALSAAGVEPRWVQVGNETRSGMLWDKGRLDWTKSGAATWQGYIALSNAGYEAVKAVMPYAQVIVHLDKAPDDNVWFFKAFKQYGGKFDAIGLSHYPEAATWQSNNTKAADNVRTLASTFSVPVLIVETGFYQSDANLAAQVMNDLFAKTSDIADLGGIFYWEPELYGWWKPDYYTRLGWNAYGKGAFTSDGKPGPALNAFRSQDDAVRLPHSDARTAAAYDLAGRKATSHTRIAVTSKHKTLRR